MKLLEYAENRVAGEISSYKARERSDALGGGFGHASRSGIDKAEYYLMGLKRVIPPAWEEDYVRVSREAENENDPEYQEYLRLKDKFKE